MPDQDITSACTRMSGVAINIMNDELHGRLTAAQLEVSIGELNNLIQILSLRAEAKREQETKP